jgi:hypothetical protein
MSGTFYFLSRWSRAPVEPNFWIASLHPSSRTQWPLLLEKWNTCTHHPRLDIPDLAKKMDATYFENNLTLRETFLPKKCITVEDLYLHMYKIDKIVALNVAWIYLFGLVLW